MVKIIIIDEAHHAAASSYDDFMVNRFGVLGLTATPIRHDEKKLNFEKILYTITFKDLIRKNVIIEPKFRNFSTNLTFDIEEIRETRESVFNTFGRNNFIANKFITARDIYSKSILYVSTVKHAKDLAKLISEKNESLDNGYKLVGYIHGGGNSLGISNDGFLNKFKNSSSAIIVNCAMLTEGFDDPSVNTIGMCVPTQSTVYYLQCIGRGIRNVDSEDNEGAFIVEFSDNLPNVKYRIDNRWLFSDISDELEPEVIEINFNNEKVLRKKTKYVKARLSFKKFNTFLRDKALILKRKKIFKKPILRKASR